MTSISTQRFPKSNLRLRGGTKCRINIFICAMLAVSQPTPAASDCTELTDHSAGQGWCSEMTRATCCGVEPRQVANRDFIWAMCAHSCCTTTGGVMSPTECTSTILLSTSTISDTTTMSSSSVLMEKENDLPNECDSPDVDPNCDINNVDCENPTQNLVCLNTCCILSNQNLLTTTEGPPSETQPPTTVPSFMPTNMPTFLPTNMPTFMPTNIPTFIPTNMPTLLPSTPSVTRTDMPSLIPTILPSLSPSAIPTTQLHSTHLTSTSSPTLGSRSCAPDNELAIRRGLISCSSTSIDCTNYLTNLLCQTTCCGVSVMTASSSISPIVPTLTFSPTQLSRQPSESPSLSPNGHIVTNTPTLVPTTLSNRHIVTITPTLAPTILSPETSPPIPQQCEPDNPLAYLIDVTCNEALNCGNELYAMLCPTTCCTLPPTSVPSALSVDTFSPSEAPVVMIPTLTPTLGPTCPFMDNTPDGVSCRPSLCCDTTPFIRAMTILTCPATCCEHTCAPTGAPSAIPTLVPSSIPTFTPSTPFPSSSPSAVPTAGPSIVPTAYPTACEPDNPNATLIEACEVEMCTSSDDLVYALAITFCPGTCCGITRAPSPAPTEVIPPTSAPSCPQDTLPGCPATGCCDEDPLLQFMFRTNCRGTCCETRCENRTGLGNLQDLDGEQNQQDMDCRNHTECQIVYTTRGRNQIPRCIDTKQGICVPFVNESTNNCPSGYKKLCPKPKNEESVSTETTETPCESILCGRECIGRCGWSKVHNICKAGARTSKSELTEGNCPDDINTSAIHVTSTWIPSTEYSKQQSTSRSPNARDRTCNEYTDLRSDCSRARLEDSLEKMGDMCDQTSFASKCASTCCNSRAQACIDVPCANNCRGLCGWSKMYNACVLGGITQKKEEGLGRCSTDGNTPSISSVETTIYQTTSASRPQCEAIRCGADCRHPCGWSRMQSKCIFGALTAKHELELGDCNSSSIATVTMDSRSQPISSSLPSTSNLMDTCSAFLCADNCTGRCGWSRKLGRCKLGAYTNPSEQGLGNCNQ